MNMILIPENTDIFDERMIPPDLAYDEIERSSLPVYKNQ